MFFDRTRKEKQLSLFSGARKQKPSITIRGTSIGRRGCAKAARMHDASHPIIVGGGAVLPATWIPTDSAIGSPLLSSRQGQQHFFIKKTQSLSLRNVWV
jgi:hypothetical protein